MPGCRTQMLLRRKQFRKAQDNLTTEQLCCQRNNPYLQDNFHWDRQEAGIPFESNRDRPVKKSNFHNLKYLQSEQSRKSISNKRYLCLLSGDRQDID